MKTLLAIAAAAVLSSGSFALAQSATPAPDTALPAAADIPAAPVSKVDTATFTKTVPSAGAFEIESSKLALDKASSADVKDFAALMIKDHTKAGEDFNAALDRSQTTAAVTPSGPALLPKEQKMLDDLRALSGGDFEAKYIEMQMQAHMEAVALFSTYANSGDDPALKEFAKMTLPTLKMHEGHVKDLAAAHQG